MVHSTKSINSTVRITQFLLIIFFLVLPYNALSQEVVQLLEKLSSPKKEERLKAAQGLLKHEYDLVREKVLPIYGTEQDEQIKEALGMILGGFGEPVALDLMIKFAQNKNISKRLHAIKALGKIGDKKASPVLLAALSDPETITSKQALIALTQLREKKAIPHILKLMPKFPDDVKKSIGYFGAEARDALVDVLGSDSEEVRKMAIKTLEGLGDPSVIPAMMKVSEKDHSVIEVVKKFGSKAVPYLLISLRSDDLFVRESSAFLLGEFQDPKAITGLVQALSNTYENASLALLKFEDKATKDLIKGLKNKNTIKACASLLGEIGSIEAIDPLIEAAASGEEEPSEAIILIGRPAVGALNKHLRSTNNVQRRAVAYAIGKIGDPRSISVLLSAVKDPNHGVRKDAIYALGFIMYRPAVLIIVKEMEMNDPVVLGECKNALIQYGKEYLTQKLEKRYPNFIKQLDVHIDLINLKNKAGISPNPEFEEEPSYREKVIRSRIRLFQSLTFNKEAIDSFGELRKETVLNEKDHYHLARLYRQSGKKRRMIDELQSSLAINPKYDKALTAVKKLGYEYKHGRLMMIVK